MKRRLRSGTLAGVALALLLGLGVFFFVRLGSHRPPSVELPHSERAPDSATVPDTEREAARRVEVTPETVQLVIERLARPENYSRSIAIERIWTGGSGRASAQVRAADGWTRVDLANDGGEQRHSITGGGMSWVWYGGAGAVYTGAASLTADEEQSIPTYEDILLLDAGSIAAADYRMLDAVACIYVETSPDEFGYTDRYWIAVENGLLAASERLRDGATVYRMTGLTVERGRTTAEAFTLPDGTVLYDPAAEGTGAAE